MVNPVQIISSACSSIYSGGSTAFDKVSKAVKWVFEGFKELFHTVTFGYFRNKTVEPQPSASSRENEQELGGEQSTPQLKQANREQAGPLASASLESEASSEVEQQLRKQIADLQQQIRDLQYEMSEIALQDVKERNFAFEALKAHPGLIHLLPAVLKFLGPLEGASAGLKAKDLKVQDLIHRLFLVESENFQLRQLIRVKDERLISYDQKAESSNIDEQSTVEKELARFKKMVFMYKTILTQRDQRLQLYSDLEQRADYIEEMQETLSALRVQIQELEARQTASEVDEDEKSDGSDIQEVELQEASETGSEAESETEEEVQPLSHEELRSRRLARLNLR